MRQLADCVGGCGSDDQQLSRVRQADMPDVPDPDGLKDLMTKAIAAATQRSKELAS